MVSFYYKVGYVETSTPWFLPKYDTVKDFLKVLSIDDELKEFKIYLHGNLLSSWTSWSVDLFIEFENWQINLDFIFLERVMAKIYRIAFEKRLLVDVTFCGNHQYSDLYEQAELRNFYFPAFNNSEFIKFDHIVKTVDGDSKEVFLSSTRPTTIVSDYLVKYDNLLQRYSEDVIKRNSAQTYIFKEGLSIDLFLSFTQTQFEQLKDLGTWGVNLNTIPQLNATASTIQPLNPLEGNFPESNFTPVR